MSKVRGYGSLKWALWCFLVALPAWAYSQYPLKIVPVDKDSAFIAGRLGISSSFSSRLQCMQYIENLPATLRQKGYPTASVDTVAYDSSFATIRLYVGESYLIGTIRAPGISKRELEQAGWSEKRITNKPLDPIRLHELQENILSYYEENGYPFAKVQVDSFEFNENRMDASLKIDRGPFYKVDSIRLNGNARISNIFLQRYLDIMNGSYYQRTKLENINRRLLELPFLQQQQPWDMTLLGEGSVLNLYLQSKKSSQINVLVGFLPANQVSNNSYDAVRTKLLFTGEATINLRNALGNGELIGLDWQQLQPSSPKLNLQYQQPYLFGSPFGIATSFDLYKKDSAYLNINFILGGQYTLSAYQTGKVYVQFSSSNLLTVDTNAIRNTRHLPDAIDYSAVLGGADYSLNKTDYRRNPRRGYELQLTGTAGIRNIRKNTVIMKMKDPDFYYASLYDTVVLRTYQFRFKTSLSKYFPLGRQSTFKAAFNGGWLQSASIYRNELFQIGGYRLLRGFDEESIFVSQYAVLTAEYRYLIGMNSYFFAFTDGAWGQNSSVSVQASNTYFGAGVGLAFETKAGVFNLSLANGKRNDTNFDLKQSKIHIGYVNYF